VNSYHFPSGDHPTELFIVKYPFIPIQAGHLQTQKLVPDKPATSSISGQDPLLSSAHLQSKPVGLVAVHANINNIGLWTSQPKYVTADIAFFELHVHLVFATKYRKRVFDAEMLALLMRTFSSVCQDLQSALEEMNGEVDHVHLLVAYPPEVSISKLVNSLKGVSSRLLRKESPNSKRGYWKGVLWSPSHFAASCGGALWHC
jgi:putative transposase